MVTVLKLGGSVITDKNTPETVDEEALDTAAAAIGEFRAAGGELVVVHGGGSFGHHHASEHGVSSSTGSHDAAGLLEIHRAMGRLTESVVDRLADYDVSPLPVRPLSAAHRGSDGETRFAEGSVQTMLGEGFVPVVNGDVVAHAGQGGTIVSGDTIVVSLAQAVEADRVGLCSTVPGVFDESGEIVPEIESYDEVAPALGGSASTDVTGGMAAKVKRLLELDSAASVFDLESLEQFLETGSAGTVVR